MLVADIVLPRDNRKPTLELLDYSRTTLATRVLVAGTTVLLSARGRLL